MIISKKALLTSLKKAMPAIETGNPTLQGADTFVFHDGNIFTCNDYIAVHTPINIDGLGVESVEGAIHADEFYKLISKFNVDEIDFTVTENSTWLLKCGRAKAEIALVNFDFESRLNCVTPNATDWVDVPESFTDAISVCRMPANKTSCNGVYITGDTVIATDGYRVSQYVFKNAQLPALWISENCVNELLKIKNFTQIQIQGTWAHFKAVDGTIFSVKTLNAEKYPYAKIVTLINELKPKAEYLHSVFPLEMFGAIDRANSFAMSIVSSNAEHSAIRLDISNDGIEISSERTSGNYCENVAWTEQLSKEIDPITVYVDANMINNMAKKSLEFYLIPYSKTPRLLFVTDNSCHLMATFSNVN